MSRLIDNKFNLIPIGVAIFIDNISSCYIVCVIVNKIDCCVGWVEINKGTNRPASNIGWVYFTDTSQPGGLNCRSSIFHTHAKGNSLITCGYAWIMGD